MKKRDRYKSTDQWEIMMPRLVELNAAGHSVRQIMTALNTEFGFAVTRNAVMGKIHRHGMVRPVPNQNAQGAPRPKNKAAAGALVNYGRYFKFAHGYRKPPEINQAASQPVFIIDLAHWHCRWPIGEPRDMRYCGADRLAPLPYCEDHARIAYHGTSSGGSKHFTQPRRSGLIT
jgi:GcrA cell cycle regulator